MVPLLLNAAGRATPALRVASGILRLGRAAVGQHDGYVRWLMSPVAPSARWRNVRKDPARTPRIAPRDASAVRARRPVLIAHRGGVITTAAFANSLAALPGATLDQQRPCNERRLAVSPRHARRPPRCGHGAMMTTEGDDAPRLVLS